jgi:O-antigen/teichoic acid export membrane protein
MFAGQGGRALLQAAYFVLLTRSLGVRDFGAFAGVVALVGALQPFGSLGTINLMIMHITMDRRSAGAQYALAVLVTGASGLVVALVLTGASPVLAPRNVAPWTVLAIACADLMGARLIDIGGAVYQAQERMLRTAAFPVSLHAARLLSAVVLVTVTGRPTIQTWALAYLLSSAVVAVPVVLVVALDVGLVRPAIHRYRTEWRTGLHFAFGLAAQSVYNDIDKAMLARLSSLEATGIYAAAYRLVDLSFTPMKAVLAASYARFFRHGATGLPAAVTFTKRIAKPGIVYCFAASAALAASAPVVPIVLGRSYAGSVDALRWLAILPLLKAIHYLAADALTGARMQSTRTRYQTGIAIANVLLNLWLIPAYAWRGAAVASLLSDGALGAALWFEIRRQTRVSRGALSPVPTK